MRNIDHLLSSRLIGGRQADLRLVRAAIHAPGVAWRWRLVFGLLAAETLVGISALAFAIVARADPELVTNAVWFRGVVVLGMTLTLFGFAWAAHRGYWWAYFRLRLFSQIFPVITLIVAALPGIYPLWMTIEQIIFSVLMIGISDLLTSDQMREAYPRPLRHPEAWVKARADS